MKQFFIFAKEIELRKRNVKKVNGSKVMTGWFYIEYREKWPQIETKMVKKCYIELSQHPKMIILKKSLSKLHNFVKWTPIYTGVVPKVKFWIPLVVLLEIKVWDLYIPLGDKGLNDWSSHIVSV